MVPVAASRRSPSVMSRSEGSQTERPHSSSFSVSVAKLLDRIDYRRADTAELREAIFRLRYQAYMRDGTITANASGTFSDHYDDTDNVYLFGLYIDGELRVPFAFMWPRASTLIFRRSRSFPNICSRS
jgi:hypothetical protein